MIKICVGLPIWGPSVATFGLGAMTRAAVESGVDGIWVGDHLVLDAGKRSKYPGKKSGQFFLEPDQNWFEAFTALGHISAHSAHLELGTGVALANLRHPALLAKQAATVSRFAGGPFGLGVGLGWSRLEYDALDIPWAGRGTRLEDTVRVVREYWTGEPQPGEYGTFMIPEDVRSYPTPAQAIPILLSGHGDLAIKRAARLGDGWLASVQSWEGATEFLAADVARFTDHWTDEGREGAPEIGAVQPVPWQVASAPDFVLDARRHLEEMQALGLNRIVFNISWRDLGATRQIMDALVAANSELG